MKLHSPTTYSSALYLHQNLMTPSKPLKPTIIPLVFWRLPEPELAIAELVLANLSACQAEPSAFINQAKLGRAELMEMPLWEGSSSGSGSS